MGDDGAEKSFSEDVRPSRLDLKDVEGARYRTGWGSSVAYWVNDGGC